MWRKAAVIVAVLALAGCSSGGFEVVKHPDEEALAIFPEGGFYDPEGACLEYVEALNEQDSAVEAWYEEAGLSRGGFSCQAI